jgi:hypothetical protein
MAYELSPVGLATGTQTANVLSVLATYKERLCHSFCIDSTLQPQVSVVYTRDAATLVGSTVFIPITAVITVVTPGCNCNATTQLYTERFTVAFQGRTALPTAVTITSVGRTQGGSNVKCGRAHSYTINDSLTITLS